MTTKASVKPHKLRSYLLTGILIAVPSWGQNSVSLNCPNQAGAGSNVLCTLALSLGTGVMIDKLTFAVVVTPGGAAPTVTATFFSPSLSGAFLSNGGTSSSISAVWASLTPSLSGQQPLGAMGFTVATSASSGQTYSAAIVGVSAALGNNLVNLSIGSSTVSIVSPELYMSPTSLSFVDVQGSTIQATQTVAVSNSGGTTLNWSASVTSGSFLSLSGAVSGTNSGTITVVVNVGSLVAGAYNGNILVTASGTTTSNISVTLVVENPPQYEQQGTKLVGSGASGRALQGRSVGLSSDGSSAIVGGFNDGNAIGAAWMFVRAGGAWTQGGSKLVGTGAIQGFVSQGMSASISADGKSALVGGNQDNNNLGAAWVYAQTGGVWIQQGEKLVGTGAVGSAFQGRSVALSADANTSIVGGNGDSNFAGAAWVFTRGAGVWTQQGVKLVGTGAVGGAELGSSVALSADGSTAITGGPSDNNGAGAAWVFTRIGGVWTQQGGKLLGTGAVGNAHQGSSVALSTDGSAAIIRGPSDNNGAGAAWVFTRIGGVWTQQGDKLVGTGAVGNSSQGSSVSLSGDGGTAIVGGYGDNSSAGAAWLFIRNGNGWLQAGRKLVGTGAIGAAQQGLAVALSADGSTALLGGWQDDSSTGAAWVFVNPNAPMGVNACDINGNGSVNVADVQLVINEVLGVSPAVHDLNHDGHVNVADVQIVINAALGLGCPF